MNTHVDSSPSDVICAFFDALLLAQAPPYTLHPTPYTLHPTPYTIHHTPYTIHHTPYTLHPTPYTCKAPAPLDHTVQGYLAHKKAPP